MDDVGISTSTLQQFQFNCKTGGKEINKINIFTEFRDIQQEQDIMQCFFKNKFQQNFGEVRAMLRERVIV